MIRILLAFSILLTALPVGPATARDLGTALEAMRQGDWDRALSDAARDGPVATDLIEWHRLRAGRGTLRQVEGFLSRRDDWPGLPLLLRRNEENFSDAPPRQLVAFYDANPPRTARGIYDHATALQALGRTGEAQATVVLAWRTLAMPQAVQDLYLARFGALLRTHHEDRLDQMIWQRDMESARRALPLVSDAWRALGIARIALHDRASGVDALIAAVPADLRDHPGLAFERFTWRHRADRDASAIELLLDGSRSADALGQPQAWSSRRRSLARSEMRAGNAARAYQIASTHHLSDGSAFADLEWLSGYLALTYLDDPDRALAHFQRFDGAVFTPISKGRAGYWIGRAHQSRGDTTAAQAAFASGARHQTSFYGLLAAEAGNLPFDTSLAAHGPAPDWRRASFTNSDVFKAALLLLAEGELDLSERFLTHLAETVDPAEAAQLGAVAIELQQPHLAVMIGKQLARRGIVIPRAYYPLHPMTDTGLPMHPEMNLAIARRESEFDPKVISGAGARGLMQIMPGTGRDVARALGLGDRHSTERMITDWPYNAQLGAAYLVTLAERFDGNVIMMSAGYNAGPARPLRWMEERGDPRRRDTMDIIDWIEHIPFNETRNYVMRVAESLPVYRARLGIPPLPQPFSAELVGTTLRWPAP